MINNENNVKSTYNEYAEFYDEQPTSLKASWNQRLRWVKGYGQVNKKYQKQLLKSAVFDKKNRWSKFEYSMSVLPVMVLLASTILYAVFTLVLGIVGSCLHEEIAWKVWRAFAIVIGVIYLFYFFYAMIMLIVERKHTNITFKNALICCLMSVFYWAMYIPLYITALFKKEVEWKPIIHNVHMDGDTRVEVSLEESESARKIDDDEGPIL